MEDERKIKSNKSTTVNSLRSEAMTDLVSYNPDPLAKWTLPISFLVILLLLGCTYFIHYPETIKTKAKLTALNAPKSISVLQEGRLLKLFVKNEDSVKKGQIIAYIETTTNHDHVLKLSNYLERLLYEVENNQEIPKFFFNETPNLGELQPAYQSFMLAFQSYSDYTINGYYTKKKSSIKDDISYLKRNYTFLLQQQDLLQKDLNLEMEAFNSNDSLFNERIISKQDFRNEKSKLINKKLSEPQMGISLLSNEVQRREKIKEIFELDHIKSQQILSFKQSILTLESQIKEWLKKYIIQSPIAGTISFSLPLQEQDLLTTGLVLGFVIPGVQQYIAEMNLPQTNFGKIRQGQTVQLQFQAYPYPEYGYVNAKIKYVSQIPTDSGYLSYLELPNGLVTNHHKVIGYRTGLTAEAVVITKEMRLSQRFYNNIVEGMKK